MTEAYELFKKLHESAGMTYLNRSKIRNFTTNIFRSNYAELERACELAGNPEVGIKLFSEEHRESGNLLHMEVMRLFHNFLASAKSLVDHTRVFIDDHYTNSSLSASYKDKVNNDFSEDPLIRFIQDLRNYMMHKGLPSGSMSLSVKRQDNDSFVAESTITIKRDDISTWSGWTKPSRMYLELAPEQIKISDLSHSYAVRINNFTDWLDREIRRHHIKDIREFKRLQRLYRDAREREESARA